MAEQQLAGGGETDDSPADNSDVVDHVRDILAGPRAVRYDFVPVAPTGNGGPDSGAVGVMLTAPRTVSPFSNEPIRDFTDPADRRSIEEALVRARASAGRTYPLVIGGEKVRGSGSIVSINPARPGEIVGRVDEASQAQVSQALDAASAAFASWKTRSAEERADVLFRAAARIRETKDDWNALLVLEVGKPWIEADADTAEAIDFLEFYAREALRLASPPPLTPIAGEKNWLTYLPLGVGVVIPPWNFAFAIMAGMTSAAVVTGNTAILKPSSDAAVIAAQFVDLMHELGLPPGVLNFVPGDGPTVGEALVTDPRTRFISFTGSKGVGLRINELAAKTPPGQRWIKRVIAEMGGKDAIVVADDADLDAAVAGVVASAYGFSGQKCSACSRAIVDAKLYDAFLAKLVPAVQALGSPIRRSTAARSARSSTPKPLRRSWSYVEIGKGEGRLLAGGRRAAGRGVTSSSRR